MMCVVHVKILGGIHIGVNNVVMLLGISGVLIAVIWKMNMARIVQDVIVLMMNKKFVEMDFVQEMKILIHVPLIAQKMVVM